MTSRPAVVERIGEIREILAQTAPKPYQRRPMPSVVDPFRPVIEAILHAGQRNREEGRVVIVQAVLERRSGD